MKAWRNATIAPLALSLLAAGAVAAQGTCEIKTDKPSQVKNAEIAFTKANFGQVEEQKRHVRTAVKLLTDDPGKIDNAAGRNYVLAQAYGWWLAKGGVPAVAKRGDVGFTTDAEGTINLATALDSSVIALESAMPQCAAETDALRRQAWAPLVTAAGNFINAGQMDSAKAALAVAQVIYPRSPYTAYYSAVAAQNSKDFAAAAEWYKKTVELITPELLASDTSFASVRAQSMYTHGALVLALADRAPPADQKARFAEAIAAFKVYIDAYPSGEHAAQARTAMARALQSAGDTAAASALFGEMLASPASYNDLQLFEAGTNAFNAERREEAAKLFQAGLEKNPYYRDALYNLTNTYMALQDGPKMVEAARRLVQVDPSNPDNWRLLAAAHQLPYKKLETELKASARDSKKQARAAAIRKEMQAINDSVLFYFTKYEKAPVRVALSNFQRAEDKGVLTGSVENLGTAPDSYTLKVEFLDASGQVVSTGEATLKKVAPKTKQDFRVEGIGAGIVAFRYAPLG
ncbi:MAG: hypothetical protein M3365_11255 [Gemmatimonadota bacterium]|nr:hypothetical protein [Gemmatimonadota bacterium]